ncbi:MAG TPA: S9 family peptidase [Steroidobacteraceae bacterium]|jgi:dipeptidyl aminopeptidase/acylaminoacyl peptidase|nr:S9 family peptidase [Steroidobacteraceae bacterium]
MRRYGLHAIAWLCWAPLGGHVTEASVPLEVYGRLPALEDVALSPDGSHIAFVRTIQNTRVVAVVSIADHKQAGGLKIGETKLRSLEWADDRHLMIVTSSTALPWGFRGMQGEWAMLQVYDVDTNKSMPVPDLPRLHDSGLFMNVVAGRPMVRHLEGHTVIFVPAIHLQGLTPRALIRVDLDTWRERVVKEGSAPIQQWLVDAAGEIIAEQDYDDPQQHWALKIRREGRLREVLSGREGIDYPRIAGWGPDADTLLLWTLEDEEPVWRLVSLRDGKLGAPAAALKDIYAPLHDPRTHHMIGGVYAGDDARYVFFDPALQRRWDSVMNAFVGEHLRLVSASDDFQKMVVQVDGVRDGFVYELVDLAAHTAIPVGEVYEGVTVPLEVRRINYAAADGLEIPAYLTLPRERAEKNLPLIVLPHGGPSAHDEARFDWWAQALADQGYAVLQPNFRGSNLNRHLLAAGFGQWGRKMQTDLSDGVRYLVKESLVDPARVCIFGASYGGYAALAGVTLDPGVYRCAISVAGISDLKRMLDWVDDKHLRRDNIEQRYWDRFLGVSGANDPVLNEISPIKHVEAVNVPVLLIHGRDDTVVSFEQSRVMADALQRAKKDVEFVTLAHEDHWLSRSETRLQMLKASVAFLRAHNPPD